MTKPDNILRVRLDAHHWQPDNILRVRLDAHHWQMLNELCQTHDRSLPDMVRKLIRDERARIGKGEKQNGK